MRATWRRSRSRRAEAIARSTAKAPAIMADLHQPHDRLFRAVFSDAGEAASLLRAALPDTIAESFEWTTLALVGGTFVDEELRESQSDLLYRGAAHRDRAGGLDVPSVRASVVAGSVASPAAAALLLSHLGGRAP